MSVRKTMIVSGTSLAAVLIFFGALLAAPGPAPRAAGLPKWGIGGDKGSDSLVARRAGAAKGPVTPEWINALMPSQSAKPRIGRPWAMASNSAMG